LVALALVALAAGGLAASATVSGRALVLARHDAAAVTLATSRLESSRAGMRTGGADLDVAADGTRFARAWTVVPGRGRPDRLEVTVAWPGHDVILSTEVWP